MTDMKKLIYTLAIAAIAAGCTEDFTDWAQPVTQPDDAAPVEIAFSAANASAIDFSTLASETVQIFVPSISAEGLSGVTYKVMLGGSESLVADASGTVEAAALKAAVENLYGKRPEIHEIPAAIEAIALIDGVGYKKTAAATVTVTLSAPFISSAYYLIGDVNGWDVSGGEQFSHSGRDVYDDPVFTLTVEIASAPSYWKISPKENHDAASWDAVGEASILGVAEDGSTSLSGSLATGNPGAAQIEEAGLYKFTINMMDYTYEIVKLEFSEFLWAPGNHNGWGFGEKAALYGPNFDGFYSGFLALDGEFKLTPAPNWDSDFGAGSGEGLLAQPAGNLYAAPGFYFMQVDLAQMTYSLTEITGFSIIGSVYGNWDADADMTFDAETSSFTFTGELSAGEYKFRANYDWGINLGGSEDSLWADGANLVLAEDGTYTIVLYPTYNGDSHCTVAKQ